MHYELWTAPGGNIIDDFASDDEALKLVRELLDGAPPDVVDSLLLTVVSEDGSGATIAAGAVLAERARTHAGQEASRPPHP
jgi:hypothetical protein